MTEQYESVLPHLARPEKQRADATRVRLHDFEALYLREQLPEYAAYTAPDADHEAVALGLAAYIDKVVREEGKNHVYLYLHTDVAATVARDAVGLSSETEYMELQKCIRDRIIDEAGATYE